MPLKSELCITTCSQSGPTTMSLPIRKFYQTSLAKFITDRMRMQILALFSFTAGFLTLFLTCFDQNGNGPTKSSFPQRTSMLQIKIFLFYLNNSAGIGRTGSLIIIDFLLSQVLRQGPHTEIDVVNTIVRARSQRPGLVQTALQYRFIYRCLAAALKNALQVEFISGPRHFSEVLAKEENQRKNEGK